MSETELPKLARDDAVLRLLAAAAPTVWLNGQLPPVARGLAASGFSSRETAAAEARMGRFAPLIRRLFPETAAAGGIIESELRRLPALQAADLPGRLWIKLDSHLPVSGSIKARGGFYEVIVLAEKLALEAGLIRLDSDYASLVSKGTGERARALFGRWSVAVGSTGNLGLSVGILASALGFRATVHMSAEARQWKKDLLRQHGAQVIEHAGSYGQAVREGRSRCAREERCHFVDDEASRELFLGYSVAGPHLKRQFREFGLEIGPQRPLIVYLPCGVGGGPGGVTFGLKQAFGQNVHCFFAEPVQAPAVILGLASGQDEKISAEDLGLSGRTAADGLAVTRPSGLVCRAMRGLLDGAFTVTDEFLFGALRALYDTEDLKLEPSALAGFYGLHLAAAGKLGRAAAHRSALHLVWATGGALVPEAEWRAYCQTGPAGPAGAAGRATESRSGRAGKEKK